MNPMWLLAAKELGKLLAPLARRRERWEYEETILESDAVWQDALNEAGADGWELVALVEDADAGTPDGAVRAVFKRVLEED